MTLKKIMNLQGQLALVTGAAGHLGRAICETLAEMGAELILVDKPGAKLKNLQASLKNKWKTQSFQINCDLESEDDRNQLIKNVKSYKKELSILVNNAAFVGNSKLAGWSVQFKKQSLATWRRAIEVNLTAAFHLSQAFFGATTKKKGNIINITSIYGKVGHDPQIYKNTKMVNPAAYSTSKGGLEQLTRWLAVQLAPNIRVNAICPGGIYRDQPNRFVKRYIKKTPLARMANENDIKGAIAFLASKASSYTTGHTLNIDGGWTIW